jgi:hypothetical protein
MWTGEKIHNAKSDWSTLSISEMVTNQAMSKRRNISGSLTQPALWKQDLWRWLYTELRGAILDGRFDAQRHPFSPP